METLQKKVFLREVDGDNRYISIDAITMFSYHIEEVSERYFDGVIFAHCGGDRLCISRDDECNYEDLENRLSEQIEEFVNAMYFDDLTEALKAFQKTIKT
jgi:hypothetical protein